jgi:hypothetical protein
MKEALDLIKKYGATAVLVLWLWHTHNRVATLEQKLFNCLERDRYEQYYTRPNEAIIPKKIEDEVKSNS